VNLPVVLCVPERQTEKACRLAKYCRDLDRTDVWVIIMTRDDDESFDADYPNNRFHSLQSYGLHRAAVEMGSSFIWLEADAIPLKPDWALILSEEYERNGQKFMLSCDSNPPHDIIGGIGCYPKETQWLVPCQFKKSGWDMWLVEAVPHLIAWTPLIQHSYGIYNDLGFAVEHRFPRDSKMLREEAVLFHRDPFQDLITNYDKA
jgi:hypothetical protein